MTKTLYQEVFGEDSEPTEENSSKLAQAIGFLPGNLGSVIIHYYLWKRSIEQVAVEVRHTPSGADEWRRNGISILRSWLNKG